LIRFAAVLTGLVTLSLAGVAAQAVQAGPGVEERPAITVATASAGLDSATAVFEQLQQYQTQIEALTGRIEELEHALSQAREQEKSRYLDTDARLKQLEQAPKAPAAVVAPVGPVAVPAAGNDEKAMFDRARALVREKKFDEAIAAVGAQGKQLPTGELFPWALYGAGE
jgi:TolA-binding protein